jgi:hypothetical protein
MSSNARSEDHALDLERDLPTTPDDVEALRRLHTDVPSWLDLSMEELDALLSDAALDQRPLARSTWEPFSLM